MPCRGRRPGARAVRVVVMGIAAILLFAPSAHAQLGSLLSPGRLARAHEKLEGLSNCTQCHESGRRVTAAKCLACHQPVAQRAGKRGVHRDVKDQCVTCHADHAGVNGELRPFDTTRFDHGGTTGFPLDGMHANVKGGCAACHRQRTFLDQKTDCASCHADVHKPSLGADCQRCHSTTTTFRQGSAGFNHAATAFPLTGAHREVACSQCHVNGTFKGTAFGTCASCHADPHRPAQGTACTTCHASRDSWRTKQVDHGRTAFALVGRHEQVECANCHRQPALRSRPKSDTCAACHVDVHRGSFAGQDCKACHDERGFAKAPFDHSKTAFALAGQHASLTCDRCHAGQARAVPARAAGGGRSGAGPAVDFRGASAACVSCHADVHQAQLGTACETCHGTDTFAVRTFTHTKAPPSFFAGQHATLSCRQCHSPGIESVRQPQRTGISLVASVRYRGVETACASCHKDVHLGQEGTQCESCHAIDVPKFAAPGFQHAGTAFALTGQHETLACALCHKPETGAFPGGQGTAVRYKGVAGECRGCHEDVHAGQLAAACETCHSTGAFRIPGYIHRNASRLTGFFAGAHARQACASCHPRTNGPFPAGAGPAIAFTVQTRCTGCHTDVHRGSLGTDCASCHRL